MTAAEQIDQQIAKLKDWRGRRLTKLREVIRGADPTIAEDWKWNTAVFTKDGNLCALGAFKDHIKISLGARLCRTRKVCSTPDSRPRSLARSTSTKAISSKSWH